MAEHGEVLVCGCQEEDLVVLRKAADRVGRLVRVVDTPGRVAQHVASSRPIAVILGFGRRSLALLDLIPAIRAIRSATAIIVVAHEDALDLERLARELRVFYYLVHPIDQAETESVLHDVERTAAT